MNEKPVLTGESNQNKFRSDLVLLLTPTSIENFAYPVAVSEIPFPIKASITAAKFAGRTKCICRDSNPGRSDGNAA